MSRPPGQLILRHRDTLCWAFLVGCILFSGFACDQADAPLERGDSRAAASEAPAQTTESQVPGESALPRDAVAVPQAQLTSVEAVGGTFALQAGACGEGECELLVSWTPTAGAQAQTALDWKVPAADVEQPQEDVWYGAQGFSAASQDQVAVTVGEEYRAVTTNLQTCKIAGDQAALLVRQQAGFEHLKHRFYVFVADGTTIKRVWSAEEGAGPYFSDVAVVQRSDGSEELIHVQGFAPPYDHEPDSLRLSRLRWSPTEKRMKEQPGRGLPVIRIAPGHGSADAARAARDQAAECIGGYWVLASSQVDPLSHLPITGPFVIAAVAATPALAETELSRVRSCLEQGEAHLAQLAN